MRIVHIIDSLDPAHGGPSFVCVSLAAAQAALGSTVRIVSYDTPGAERQIREMLGSTPHAGQVDIAWVPRPAPGIRTILAAEARRRLPGALQGADFAILHGVWDRILLAGAAAAAKAGVPYAVIPHGMLSRWRLGQKRFKKQLALRMTVRRMLNRAAFIHALNADEAAGIQRLGLGPPIEVIPNGVFLEQIDPQPPAGTFAAIHPAVRGRPYILFLSRLHSLKGLDVLAEAFAIVARRNADAWLIVAGPDDGQRAKFVEQVARLGLTDRVHLPGPLYGRDKIAGMWDARCFCLPSRDEGFSMAIVEALACRCPAVISENCHFPEVGAAGAGAVVALHPPAIAAAMVPYLTGPAREAAGRAARGLVESAYTWSRIAQRTLDLCGRYAGARAR